MYDRKYGDQTLSFEASGALKDASLVMRDRETDSWWAIMSGKAIGGPREGERLQETTLGEKAQWADWRARHPETKVLAVTHMTENGYAGYFDSERTFRDADPEDDRLGPREPVFTFRLQDAAYAIRTAAVEGGRVLELDDGGSTARVFLYRQVGADLFASTRAWRLHGDTTLPPDDPVTRLAELEADGEAERIPGFDTFWYVWIPQNREGTLLE